VETKLFPAGFAVPNNGSRDGYRATDPQGEDAFMEEFEKEFDKSLPQLLSMEKA